MPKLTKKMIDKLEKQDKDYSVFDSELPGFGVRVLPSGRKSYILQYRASRTKVRKKALGMHGVIALDEARKKAFSMLAEVQSGIDPVGVTQEKQNALTLRELAQKFITEHIDVHLKEKTAWGYKRNLDKFFLPELGDLKVTEVQRSDIAAFHHRRRKTPYEANRCFAMISKMFNLAEMWGMRPDNTNPCRHLKKYPEYKRERYLTSEETKRLGEVLRQMVQEESESLSAIHCIKLLLFTGCRLSEIQTMKWAYIKWDQNEIHLPDSKTGAKTVYISNAVIQLLHAIKSHLDTPIGNPYVIYGKLEGAHLTDMQKPWQRIRKRAGLSDVRIHDLRHSFASYAASQGMSLQMIGKLLGHTQVQTTARYAHLMSDSIKEAAGQVANAIGDGVL
jgi:integrase